MNTFSNTMLLLLVVFAFSSVIEAKTSNNLQSSSHSGVVDEKKIKFPILSDVEKNFRQTNTLSIDFEQTQKNLTSGLIKKTFGKIFLQKPGSYHWLSSNFETKKPESLLVSNGVKMWFYSYPNDPKDKGQVVIRKQINSQSQIALKILFGSESIEKDFNIKDLKNFKFELTPKKSLGDIDHLELQIENTTKTVYKLVLITLLGNETELLFKKTEALKKLDKKFFEFVVPKGTEEI